MALHPTQVQWFEARVPREHTVHALEMLAGSQRVELESTTEATIPCYDRESLTRILDSFSKLASRIAELPGPDQTPPEHVLLNPVALAEHALATLRNWHIRLLDLQRAGLQLENECESLSLLQELQQAITDEQLDVRLSKSSQFLSKHLFTCPKGVLESPDTSGTVNRLIEGERHDFWIVLGDPQLERLLDGTARLLDCRELRIPQELPQEPSAARQWLTSALQRKQDSLQQHKATLSRHFGDPALRQALANMRLLRWYSRHPLRHDPEQKACRVCGWTLYAEPETMETLLREEGIEARVIFSQPRGGLTPPVYLSQSHWAKPFHHLLAMVGTPGHQEVDPTPLLAWLVPLLFGFMFPDLGHGLILMVVGLVAAKRHPAARILVSCGLAASGFGLLFGEFFGATGVLTPLFGCPLEYTQEILLATLLLGIFLMMLGLLFAGLEAYWRGEIGGWMLEGAPVVVLYLSAALALLWPDALAITLGAGIWYLTGVSILSRQGGLRTLFNRLGQLLESALQLIVNTLSFLRVGAFALAHCALSLMVLQLTDAVEHPLAKGSVFLLGQTLIILLEGLIVTIQTTRLVLFEFFIRFLHFEGRIYQPLQGPEAEDKASRKADHP
ncbi:MAG: V-type ATPase 116kDa subunit family protein [Candidatus Thiodiazotropha sp.]